MLLGGPHGQVIWINGGPTMDRGCPNTGASESKFSEVKHHDDLSETIYSPLRYYGQLAIHPGRGSL